MTGINWEYTEDNINTIILTQINPKTGDMKVYIKSLLEAPEEHINYSSTAFKTASTQALTGGKGPPPRARTREDLILLEAHLKNRRGFFLAAIFRLHPALRTSHSTASVLHYLMME